MRATHPPTAVPLLLVAALAILPTETGCTHAPRPQARASAAVAPAAPPPFASWARERQQSLQGMLSAVLKATLPKIRAVQEQLRFNVEALELPERLLSVDPAIREWRGAEAAAHKATVNALYDTARERLTALHEGAMAHGLELARTMAAERSPLDEGPTGDVLLDQQLTSFSDTLRAEVALEQLHASQQRDAKGRIELVQKFSSFAVKGADDALGGRLMLFVGGEVGSVAPRCQLALKTSADVSPDARRFFQVMRHRVMRGHTMVEDLGWRVMPAVPRHAVLGDVLFGDDVAPRIRDDLEAFDQLKDMRIVVDVQSAVLDVTEGLLGGVNWRIEFRVTTRGVVSWQPGSTPPAFDPICAEARALLAAADPD